MSEGTELTTFEPMQRVRINAKQSAKGSYQLDVTFADEAATVDIDGAARKLVEAIQAAERELVAAGKKVALEA